MGRRPLPRRLFLLVIALLTLVGAPRGPGAAAVVDPLPSWNEGPSKWSILAFVGAVTAEGSPDHVPPDERIAVFDNDGTLWAEMPVYVQLRFAIDRVKQLAPDHPEWRDQQPFRAVLEGDMKALAAGGERGIVAIIAASHAGMTTDEFAAIARRWLATAEHPRFGRRYAECV